MSGWGSRIGSWGSRFGSPFGGSFVRTPGEDSTESPVSPDPPTVTDHDFSYITAADIAKNKSKDQKTDAIVLKHRRISYPIHYPAGSIDDGELTVGKIRQSAAEKAGLSPSEAGRIKLYFRGKNLKDDDRTAKEEGMRSGAAQMEILMVVGDKIEVPSNLEDDDEEEVDDEDDDNKDKIPGAKKKRRGKKKNKRANKSSSGPNSGTATPTSSGPSFNPDATFVPHAPRATPLPPSASAPPRPVQTPLEKLDVIASHFHTKLVPECVSFISRPPEEAGKREFEHKRLTETILAQVLLKLDAVETEGDQAARQRRKDLVKEVQGMLNQLDTVIKGT